MRCIYLYAFCCEIRWTPERRVNDPSPIAHRALVNAELDGTLPRIDHDVQIVIFLRSSVQAKRQLMGFR